MMNYGNDSLLDIMLRLAQRLPVTLTLLVLSAVLGLLLGIVLAVIRIRKKPVSYALATAYVSFMRCTPTLVQLFLIFYGLPQLLMVFNINVINWNIMIFAIITFSLHSAAFFSEVIRSAYLAVGSGQQEAGYSIGMSYVQTLRRIILPQAFGIAMPNLGNNLIILMKETSLAFSIGIIDLMGQAYLITGSSYGTNILAVYVMISLFYWAISITIEKGTGYWEKRLKRGRVSIAGRESVKGSVRL